MGFTAEVAIFIILMFFVMVFFRKLSKKKTINSIQNLNSKIAELKNEILVVNDSSIPNKQIVKTLGIVRGISDSQATTKEEFHKIENEALYNMLMQAKAYGANAIISVQFTTGTYEQQGSKWQSSQAVYTGTAVVVE